MNVEVGTPLEKTSACKQTTRSIGERLSGRRAGRTVFADSREIENRSRESREAGHGGGRLQSGLRGRQRNRDVADVANLAMLLVVGIIVIVNQRVEAQRADHEDQRDGQNAGRNTFCRR